MRPKPRSGAAVCRRRLGAGKDAVQPHQSAKFELVGAVDFVVPRRDAGVDFLDVFLRSAVNIVDALHEFRQRHWVVCRWVLEDGVAQVARFTAMSRVEWCGT